MVMLITVNEVGARCVTRLWDWQGLLERAMEGEMWVWAYSGKPLEQSLGTNPAQQANCAQGPSVRVWKGPPSIDHFPGLLIHGETVKGQSYHWPDRLLMLSTPKYFLTLSPFCAHMCACDNPIHVCEPIRACTGSDTHVWHGLEVLSCTEIGTFVGLGDHHICWLGQPSCC